MNCTIDTTAFKAALATVRPAVGRHGIWAGARLSAVDGRLSISACDVDTTMTCDIAADIATEGVAVIDHRLLSKLVRGRGPFTLRSIDQDHMAVVNGITSTVDLLNDSDWPKAPDFESTATYPLDLDALAIVIPAASTDQARPILTGVLFTGSDVVASDSFRLHIATSDVSLPDNLLVPASTLAQVVNYAAKRKTTATLQVSASGNEPTQSGPWRSSSRAKITIGNLVIVTRLIDGEFPNYKALMPQATPNTLTVERKNFIAAIAAVSAMAEKNTITPVRLEIAETTTTLRVQSYERGESVATLPSSLVGRPITIAFNPKYLASACTVGRGDTITLGYTDALKPALITDHSPSTRLIMPIRVT